jgi:hypothetical protein
MPVVVAAAVVVVTAVDATAGSSLATSVVKKGATKLVAPFSLRRLNYESPEHGISAYQLSYYQRPPKILTIRPTYEAKTFVPLERRILHGMRRNKARLRRYAS